MVKKGIDSDDCRNCGFLNPVGINFCRNCGFNFQTGANYQPQPDFQPQQGYQQQPQYPPNQGYENQGYQQYMPYPHKKDNTLLYVILIILGVTVGPFLLMFIIIVLFIPF